MQNERSEIERLSCEMLTRYHESNDTALYFDHLDDKILWLGPGRGQYFEGKASLLAAFAKESNTLRFRLSDVASRVVRTGRQSCEVLLRYEVDTLFPSGMVTRHFQRTTLLWCEKPVQGTLVWRVVLMHISNEETMDGRDCIYPLHHDELVKNQASYFCLHTEARATERLAAKGVDGAVHFVPCRDIVYIKSGKGKLSTIHTERGELTVRLLMRELMERLPKTFCRVHAGYIVNTDAVASVGCYFVRLKNGLDIPVPVKRYHAVLADVTACIENQRDKGGSKPCTIES